MKIDEATKIIAGISAAVGIIISVAGFFANTKIQVIQQAIQELNIKDKQVDISKRNYDLSARLSIDYSAPLARSFALQFSTNEENRTKYNTYIMFPISQISDELGDLIVQWRQRKGLMTGKACEREGLKARQVVLIKIKNIGNATAENVIMKVNQGSPQSAIKGTPWNIKSTDGIVVPYADLAGRIDEWKDINIPIGRLFGLDSQEKERLTHQIVLASVSGSTDLYGTVLFPLELSWTDSITNENKLVRLDVSYLRNDLLGAEIGSLSSACK